LLLLLQGRPGTAGAEPPPSPPQGWWVPATLKLPRAAEGRLAWRFTLREIITINKDGKPEVHPADFRLVAGPVAAAAGKVQRWQTTAAADTKAAAVHTASPARPVAALPPLTVEYDETQGVMTVTFTGDKTAFFTLNPAGSADIERFDDTMTNRFADPAAVNAVCQQAARCCQATRQPEGCVPANSERTLTHCRAVLARVRQELAASHHAIHASCR
jgi:hypothetical protein